MAYVYDDAGERVIKTGPQGETAYVNLFYVVRNREVATKHIFAGGSRLVSQLAAQPDENGNTTTPTAGNSGQTPWGWSNGNGNGGNNGNGGGNGNNNNNAGGTPFEVDQYFYHPDHLGSSSYVTDIDGEIFQHVEYFPFGETFFQESSNTQRTPYLFTGKELDEETGLYYFGARYYDPRTSVWQSADPILASYMTGKRGGIGVFTPRNLSLYSYSHNRPINMSDVDGNEPIIDWFDSQTRADQVNLGIALSNYMAADEMLAMIETGGIDRAIGEVYYDQMIIDGNGAASRIGVGRGWRIFGDVMQAMEDFGPAFGAAGMVGRVPTKPVGNAVEDAAGLIPKAITSLGRWGETRLGAYLQFAGRKPDSAFHTSQGLRYVDRLVDGIAHEAKAGVNVRLTSTYRTQILKDAELIRGGDIDGAVWHFFQGADQSIKDFLTQNGIRFIEH